MPSDSLAESEESSLLELLPDEESEPELELESESELDVESELELELKSESSTIASDLTLRWGVSFLLDDERLLVVSLTAGTPRSISCVSFGSDETPVRAGSFFSTWSTEISAFLGDADDDEF